MAALTVEDIDPAARGSTSTQNRRSARVPVLSLSRGVLPGGALEQYARRAFGMFVLDGLLIRDMYVGETTASELIGPGDVISPRRCADELLPTGAGWTVSTPARLAVLDERLAGTMGTNPELGTRLLVMMARQTARLTAQRAVSQLPRVEERLLALFWLLAERWGRVGSGGVIVPLSLTHEILGRLVGAQRPTVTLALKALAAEGSLGRRRDGSWLLSARSAARLQPHGKCAPSRATLLATASPARRKPTEASDKAQPEHVLVQRGDVDQPPDQLLPVDGRGGPQTTGAAENLRQEAGAAGSDVQHDPVSAPRSSATPGNRDLQRLHTAG